MPAVAEVEFKAVNAEGVVSAFNSVGGAAQDSGTKIQENGSAMKNLGSGMKSGIGIIGNVATAFTALSLSVVNTWRSYRDLGDAQIQVDKANLKLTKSTQAVAAQEKIVAGLKKEAQRGNKETAVNARKIALAEQKLNKDRKEHKMTDLEIAVRQDEINKMRDTSGTEAAGKLKDAEQKLTNLRDTLEINTANAERAQKRFNDTQQDFYLSILPTGLGMLGSVASTVDAVKTSIGSGKLGLVGAFGGLGLVLTAGALAIKAYQENWLGFRDAIGGVIDWVKARFGDWQKTITEVFDLIRGGDWGGAFERIKKAAVDFWNDLVSTVPFFGGINKVVDAIRQGKWDTAFNIIKEGALKFWEDLKQKVPFFAGAEKFFSQLFAGDFSGAWDTLKTGLVSAWEAIKAAVPILGDIETYLRGKWEKANVTAQATFNAMANELKKPGGAFDRISQGLALIGSGDVGGGMAKLKEGIDLGIEQIKNAINNWVMVNFGIDLSILEGQAKDLGMKIMGWIGNGLTFVSTEFVDPFVASLFKVETWTSALTAIWSTILTVGSSIMKFLLGSILNFTADPAKGADFWGKIGQGIWDGITGWMKINMPDTTAVLEAIAQSITDKLAGAGEMFKKAGAAIWNGLIEGIKTAIAGLDPTGALRAALDKLKIDIPVTVNTQKGELDVNKFQKKLAFVDVPKVVVVKANVQGTAQVDMLGRSINKLSNKTVTVTTVFRQVGNQAVARGRSQGGQGVSAVFHGQHGLSRVTRGPELFLAGEAGRKERVTVQPVGSVHDQAGRGRGPGVGGGGEVYIGPIYLDGLPVMGMMRYRINDNQGVVK